MHANSIGRRFLRAVFFVTAVSLAANVGAAPLEPVMSLAAKEKALLLDTLKELVSIESGSGDREAPRQDQ